MKSKKLIVSILLGLLFFLGISYSIFVFNATVNYELEKSVRSTLSDMADQQQLALNRQLESMIYNAKNFAETLPIIGVNESDILSYVNEKQELLNYETVLIVDANGTAFLSTGKFADVSQTEYYNISIQGTDYVSSVYISPYAEKEVVLISVPIYVDGKVDGVLAAEYCTTYLDTLLTTFTDERGLNLIVDGESNIILSTNSFVISFDAFKSAEFESGVSFESVTDDFKEKNSGSISYVLNGERKFGEYRPIIINDWMLFFEISEESIATSVQNISNSMILVSTIIILTALGAIGYFVISKNNSEKVLEQAAYYDELTGLPNLLKYKMLMAEALEKEPDKKYIAIKLDLVNFKAINEMFGYEAGNKVIRAIANTGKNVPDKSFFQARVSAEEFMFFSQSTLFEDLESSSKEYEILFKELLPEMSEHHFLFRYGRYYLSPGENNVNDIVNKVNIAHSFAKNDSMNNIWDYDETFTQKVLRDTQISNKKQRALENREFKVFLQPKCNINNGRFIGAEALVRWIEPDGKMFYPNEFIPLFEQNGFIAQLDKYMLHRVCETLKSWREMGKECLAVSVNFSRLHIKNKNFVNEIKQIVSSYGVDPKYIEIELTESTVLENEKELKVLLKELHGEGFLVSIDDFGSGYSSLGMLKNFKVNTLKLDRSFFIELDDEEEHRRGDLVVESIVELANNLGMYTVAEGIEDIEQIEFLRKIKCDAAQGYYFAKPMPIEGFEELYFKQKLMESN